jgi:dihydroorotate dehydrogenase (NAD+) catalytic subunit
MVDTRTQVGSVELRHPVMTASGTAGHGDELRAHVDLASIGAVVVKSLSAEPWPGNPAPRVHETAGGMLNSVGLQGPGVDAWMRDELPPLLDTGATVVASIWGRTVDDYERAAVALADAPAEVVAVEVNLSCPNLGHGSGRSLMFAQDPGQAAAATQAALACRRPVWAKLTAAVADLAEIAEAVDGAGAEAVTLINTLPGLAIDPDARRLRLGGPGGGLSGPAIHAVAVRAVHDVHRARPELPIVGVGGIARPADAIELLLAGASAVQVGTASFADPRAVGRIAHGLTAWCHDHHLSSVTELIGAVHAC